jgi:putative CocE/NonD family hydrolase
MCAASKHKKLRIHTGTHFHPFYAEEARIDQLRWFDYWLKDIDTGIMDEPPVKLEIRTGGSTKPYPFRFENEWPLARTQWTKYYLRIDRAPSEEPKAVEGELTTTLPAKTATASYGQAAASRPGNIPRGVSFETPPMAEDTEITGPVVLNLWVSSTAEDMDIFATIRHIGPDGKDLVEVGQQGEPLQCVTKGWLRASHRKLDPEKSLPYRPYHAHNERQWLKPGEVVECQVEIWATCMVFRKGYKLRLDISPADGVGTQHFTHFAADYNQGAEATIHSGGDRPSYLLLPVIPPK